MRKPSYSGRRRNIERFDETGKNDYNNNQFHHNIITDIEFFLGISNMMREQGKSTVDRGLVIILLCSYY